ncbi:MAG TPA: hypothetical protein VFM18_07145 [Methanosarcina sp.]|nr:hypothetical protein [Methanosarcina sp.]
MYYEERHIGNSIYYRNSPNGTWTFKKSVVPEAGQSAYSELVKLTEEQRLEVFHFFCVHCGQLLVEERLCNCVRDE